MMKVGILGTANIARKNILAMQACEGVEAVCADEGMDPTRGWRQCAPLLIRCGRLISTRVWVVAT